MREKLFRQRREAKIEREKVKISDKLFSKDIIYVNVENEGPHGV